MFFVILRFFKFLHLVNESEINRLTVFGMVYDLLDLAQGYAYNTVLFLLNRTPSFAENFLLLFETVNFSIEFAYKKSLPYHISGRDFHLFLTTSILLFYLHNACIQEEFASAHTIFILRIFFIYI